MFPIEKKNESFVKNKIYASLEDCKTQSDFLIFIMFLINVVKPMVQGLVAYSIEWRLLFIVCVEIRVAHHMRVWIDLYRNSDRKLCLPKEFR